MEEYGSQLLIEPVWNRNEDRIIPYKSALLLLIEPVWNRNFHVFNIRKPDIPTFNRTSLE